MRSGNLRHREQGGPGHGEGRGEGQRLELPSLQVLQGKDGQERHGDNQESEEQGLPDLERAVDQSLMTGIGSERRCLVVRALSTLRDWISAEIRKEVS